MTLYRVTLKGFTVNYTGRARGISYVVANDAEEAYQKVKTYLDERDYGFIHDRALDKVEVIADTSKYGSHNPKLYL